MLHYGAWINVIEICKRMPEFANAGICWVLCKNGVFSVRSFYDALETGVK